MQNSRFVLFEGGKDTKKDEITSILKFWLHTKNLLWFQVLALVDDNDNAPRTHPGAANKLSLDDFSNDKGNRIKDRELYDNCIEQWLRFVGQFFTELKWVPAV